MPRELLSLEMVQAAWLAIIGERKVPCCAEGRQAASALPSPHQAVLGEGRPAFRAALEAGLSPALHCDQLFLSGKLNMSQRGEGGGEVAEASRPSLREIHIPGKVKPLLGCCSCSTPPDLYFEP